MKSNPSRATTLCALVSTHKIQTLASGTLPSFRNASSILLQSFFNPSSILLRSFFNRLKLLTLGPIDTIHAFPPPWCDSGSSNSSCKIFLNILEDREPRDASQNYHWIHYKLYLPQAHILETNIYRERRYVSIMLLWHTVTTIVFNNICTIGLQMRASCRRCWCMVRWRFWDASFEASGNLRSPSILLQYTRY